jgi:hypothetical protein
MVILVPRKNRSQLPYSFYIFRITIIILIFIFSVLWGEIGSNTGEHLGKLISLCGAQVRACKEVPKLSAFLEFAGNVQMCSSLTPAVSRSLTSILLGLLSHRYL